MELEQDEYDVVVIGTGLAESIAAAALAKSGRSVLHLDPNEYYGSSQASLTLDELSSLASASSSSSSFSGPSHLPRFSSFSVSELSPDLQAARRQYALSLFPSVLPSRGPLITTLIASDVSKYVSFRLLDFVSVWDDETGSVRKVPGSKEDVFKDTSVGLVEKRRLMKFLVWAGGDFERDEILLGNESQPLSQFLEQSFSLAAPLAKAITYAIAHCSTLTDATLPALQRTRRYLRSIGRYGSGAFLVGQYGGAGEIAQGFCRACAVHGGTYVLGPSGEPSSIELDGENGVRLGIPCHPRPVRAKHLVSAPDHLPLSLRPDPSRAPTRSTAHCIAVLPYLPTSLKRQRRAEGEDEQDRGEIGNGNENGSETETENENETENDDTAVVLFPPSTPEADVVRGLLMGQGTGSCPSGQYILYLYTRATQDTDPAARLSPYLHKLHPDPLFTSFYLQDRPAYLTGAGPSSHPPSAASSASSLVPSPSSAVVLLSPYSGRELLTEGLDWEAEQGEAAFWAVAGPKDDAVEAGKGFFDAKSEGDEPEVDGNDL